MLIELAKTDRAMSWAYKHNRYDLYEDRNQFVESNKEDLLKIFNIKK